MGALSALMGNLPSQMANLGSALERFEDAHDANVESLAGDPDWQLTAEIQVESILKVTVTADFDLQAAISRWRSTQMGGFKSLVGGLVGESIGEEADDDLTDQVMEQLSKGRGIARVCQVIVQECRIAGAPADAAERLKMSPEANIPLVMDENGLGFEFAPMLTIQNRWEEADTPTFTPMGEDVVVPLSQFDSGVPLALQFTPEGQDYQVTIKLRLAPIE